MQRKKLNYIVIGDIHIGKKDDGMLFDELQEFFIPQLNEELDLLIIAGDLFDRVIKMNEISSNYAITFINQILKLSKLYDFKVRILKGTKTHDNNQLNNFKHHSDNYDFEIIDFLADEVLEIKGIEYNILYIPEEYIDDYNTHYGTVLTEDESFDMIFFHGTFDFAGYAGKLGHEKQFKNAPTFKATSLMKCTKGPIIGGHVHEYMNHKDKIFYTGSFTRHGYGEEKSKGFIKGYYIKEDNEFIVDRIINTKAPMYITYDIKDFDDNLSIEEKIELMEELKKEYGNIRIKLDETTKNENSGLVHALKTISDKSLKILVDNNFEERYDSNFEFILKDELSFEAGIQKFIKLTKNIDIEVEDINKVLETTNI